MEYVLRPGIRIAESFQARRWVSSFWLLSCFLIVATDWLRERIYFEGLVKDDKYAKIRLGFSAPNIFLMQLVS